MAGTDSYEIGAGTGTDSYDLGGAGAGIEQNFTGGFLNINDEIAGWKITGKLDVTSGEAEIYEALKDGDRGIVKYYMKEVPGKTLDILNKIKGLNHPDIINLHQFGFYEKTNRFYEIMEFAEGGAVSSKTPGGAWKYLPMNEDTVEGICREVVNAFKTCHDAGIIHRDIKPDNIYFRHCAENPDGTLIGSDAVVADFGISSITDNAAAQHRTVTASRTMGYAPPELLIAGEIGGVMIRPEISCKVDYYALGITLWQLLTGLDPFTMDDGTRRNEAALARDTRDGRVVEDLLSRVTTLSEKMQRLIRGLLVTNPEFRWGYDEVTGHLDGKKIEIWKAPPKPISLKIGDKICTSREEIGAALLENSDIAQRYVYRGLLVSLLKNDYPEDAEKIAEIAEVASATNMLYNGILKTAFTLNPSIPLQVGNGYSAANHEEIIRLLSAAPETMLPLLRDKNSKLYAYLDVIGKGEQGREIISLLADKMSAAELCAKAEVILRDKTIKPFLLERHADFTISTLEKIRNIPVDMQRRILALIAERNYEGLFVPWFELVSEVKLSAFKGGWKELIALVDAMALMKKGKTD